MTEKGKVWTISAKHLTFAAYVILVLMLTACSVGGDSPASEVDTEGASGQSVNLTIDAPSASELVIAPGRHFKVSGSLDGDVPNDAIMKVALLDSSGREVRFAATDSKGTDRVTTSWYKGTITTLQPDTDFAEIAYTAPELAVADADAPEASAHDATVKCVYTDETFYALITAATDPDHGLVCEDGYNLVDHDGSPYDALPEGKYTIEATLMDAGGDTLASDSKDIVIGKKDGTVIHEITTQTAVDKGGMDLLSKWAEAENTTILGDLLPGMFGPYYQMTTMQMSVGAETAEYLPGAIEILVYGNTADSTSYCLEVAQYLHLQHNTENPDVASYYAFDLGEPRFSGKQAQIVAFDKSDDIRICRVDIVSDETQDGVFLTTEEQVLGYDADASDGFTVSEDKAFAVAGVMKPYQLQDDELVPDEQIFGYYNYLNGPQTLMYMFVPVGGGEVFNVNKTVGLSRIDSLTDDLNPAVYEFYSVFPAGTLQAGEHYDVTVQAYDRKGNIIEGMTTTFQISGDKK